MTSNLEDRLLAETRELLQSLKQREVKLSAKSQNLEINTMGQGGEICLKLKSPITSTNEVQYTQKS